MSHVRDLLAQVFVAKGYHVEEGPMGGLLAKSPGETLLVEWKGDSPATSGDMRALSAALGPCGAQRAVFVAAAGAPAGVVHEGTHLKIETWSLARAALEVGMCVLEAAQGLPVNPAPAENVRNASPPHHPAPTSTGTTATSYPTPIISPSASVASSPIIGGNARPLSLTAQAAALSTSPSGAMFLPSKPREIKHDSKMLPSAWDVASGSARLPSSGFDGQSTYARSGVVEIKSKPKPKAAEAAPAPAPGHDAEIVGGAKVKVAPSAKSAPPLPADATLRVVYAAQEAAAKATSLGRIQTAKLTLVPHIAFDFDCHVEHEALPQAIEAKGTLLIHSASGVMREVAALDLGEQPKDGEKVPGRLTALDVYDRVKSHLLKQTTRDVKVEKDVGGVTVMGTERVGPHSPEELGLAHRGIVHVPIWHFVGEHGSIDIDAFTGDVVPAK